MESRDERSAEGEAAQSADSPAEQDSRRQESRSKSRSSKASFWETYRTPIVSVILGGLFLQIFPVVRDFSFGVLDAGRDVAVSLVNFDAGNVDDLKERVEDRPYWSNGEPEWLDASLDFLRSGYGDDELLYNPGGGEPEVYSPEQIVADAVDLAGKPIVLVGQVVERENLGGETAYTYSSVELRVRGTTSEPYVFVGLGGEPTAVNTDQDVGSIIAVSGVVTARGRVETNDGRELQSAYFTGLVDFALDASEAVEAAAKRLRRKP